MKVRFLISDLRWVTGYIRLFLCQRRANVQNRSEIRNQKSNIPRGISLMEVLISMFVLLFGLMGIAAIFPVGTHYVVEGENHDLGSGIGQNAIEELQTRGMLNPEVWLYAGDPPQNEQIDPTAPTPPYPQQFPLVIQDSGASRGFFNVVHPNVGPGRAFVLDPIGTAAGVAAELPDLDVFPYVNLATNATNVAMPTQWQPAIGPFSEQRWPVRRITIPIPDATGALAFDEMDNPVAETIFRLRDDLIVTQPDENDRPSIQTWDIDNTGNAPKRIRRQYQGNYSWLATIVPKTNFALQALQPAAGQQGQFQCDVSVVVFRKRETTPSNTTERVIEAEMFPGGELVMYHDDQMVVDAALDEIRPGNWIAVMGVNQVTDAFAMKWYRLLSLDKETEPMRIESLGESRFGRRAMLDDVDWNAPPSTLVNGAVANLRVGILPDVVRVTSKEVYLGE